MNAGATRKNQQGILPPSFNHATRAVMASSNRHDQCHSEPQVLFNLFTKPDCTVLSVPGYFERGRVNMLMKCFVPNYISKSQQHSICNTKVYLKIKICSRHHDTLHLVARTRFRTAGPATMRYTIPCMFNPTIWKILPFTNHAEN